MSICMCACRSQARTVSWNVFVTRPIYVCDCSFALRGWSHPVLEAGRRPKGTALQPPRIPLLGRCAFLCVCVLFVKRIHSPITSACLTPPACALRATVLFACHHVRVHCMQLCCSRATTCVCIACNCAVRVLATTCVCIAAMHFLGVPTTRSASLVTSDSKV